MRSKNTLKILILLLTSFVSLTYIPNIAAWGFGNSPMPSGEQRKKNQEPKQETLIATAEPESETAITIVMKKSSRTDEDTLSSHLQTINLTSPSERTAAHDSNAVEAKAQTSAEEFFALEEDEKEDENSSEETREQIEVPEEDEEEDDESPEQVEIPEENEEEDDESPEQVEFPEEDEEEDDESPEKVEIPEEEEKDFDESQEQIEIPEEAESRKGQEEVQEQIEAPVEGEEQRETEEMEQNEPESRQTERESPSDTEISMAWRRELLCMTARTLDDLERDFASDNLLTSTYIDCSPYPALVISINKDYQTLDTNELGDYMYREIRSWEARLNRMDRTLRFICIPRKLHPKFIEKVIAEKGTPEWNAFDYKFSCEDKAPQFYLPYIQRKLMEQSDYIFLYHDSCSRCTESDWMFTCGMSFLRYISDNMQLFLALPLPNTVYSTTIAKAKAIAILKTLEPILTDEIIVDGLNQMTRYLFIDNILDWKNDIMSNPRCQKALVKLRYSQIYDPLFANCNTAIKNLCKNVISRTLTEIDKAMDYGNFWNMRREINFLNILRLILAFTM